MSKKIVAVCGQHRVWVGELHEENGNVPARLKKACQIFYIQAQNIQREMYMQTIPMKMGDISPIPEGDVCELDESSPLMADYTATWTNLIKPELLDLPPKMRQ